MATPRTASEIEDVRILSADRSVIGGLKPSSGTIWIWAYGPYANTVFYNDDVGDITVSAPWRGGANLDGGSTLASNLTMTMVESGSLLTLMARSVQYANPFPHAMRFATLPAPSNPDNG